MSKQKPPKGNRLRVKVVYHIGVAGDFTAETVLTAHYIENIPNQYKGLIKKTLHDKLHELLGSFNKEFKAGNFRFSFNCTREEYERKTKIAPRKAVTWPRLNARIHAMLQKIEKVIVAFLRSAKKSFLHIAEVMDSLTKGMNNGFTPVEIVSQL